jgi:hypothetical protein
MNMPINDAVDQVLQLPGRAGGVEHRDDGAGKSNETGLHIWRPPFFPRKNRTNAQEGTIKGSVTASLEEGGRERARA